MFMADFIIIPLFLALLNFMISLNPFYHFSIIYFLYLLIQDSINSKSWIISPLWNPVKSLPILASPTFEIYHLENFYLVLINLLQWMFFGVRCWFQLCVSSPASTVFSSNWWYPGFGNIFDAPLLLARCHLRRLWQSKPDKEHPCKPGNHTFYILIIHIFSSVPTCLLRSDCEPGLEVSLGVAQITAAWMHSCGFKEGFFAFEEELGVRMIEVETKDCLWLFSCV